MASIVILNGAKRSEESQILRFAQDDNGEILRFAQDNEGTIAPAYFRAYGSRARPPLGRAVLGRKFDLRSLAGKGADIAGFPPFGSPIGKSLCYYDSIATFPPGDEA